MSEGTVNNRLELPNNNSTASVPHEEKITPTANDIVIVVPKTDDKGSSDISVTRESDNDRAADMDIPPTSHEAKHGLELNDSNAAITADDVIESTPLSVSEGDETATTGATAVSSDKVSDIQPAADSPNNRVDEEGTDNRSPTILVNGDTNEETITSFTEPNGDNALTKEGEGNSKHMNDIANDVVAGPQVTNTSDVIVVNVDSDDFIPEPVVSHDATDDSIALPNSVFTPSTQTDSEVRKVTPLQPLPGITTITCSD